MVRGQDIVIAGDGRTKIADEINTAIRENTAVSLAGSNRPVCIDIWMQGRVRFVLLIAHGYSKVKHILHLKISYYYVMGKIYKAANLNDALQLAEEFRATNKYDLFRGQARNWPIIPSALRIDSITHEEAVKKLERLYYFFQTNSFAKKYATDIDWFFAVAQHYGLPTRYLDFTFNPAIATYFATHSKSNKIGEECVIICIKESEFKSFLTFTSSIYAKHDEIPPYIARINVDNLWRLQTQEGCFLYMPYIDFETLYTFDKIIFPFTEPFSELKDVDIYPERKSELETILDHYFNVEEKITGQRELRRFAEEMKIPILRPGEKSGRRLLKKKKKHLSWATEHTSKWEYSFKEEWQRTEVSHTLKLSINFKETIGQQITSLQNALSIFFSENKVSKENNIRFEIIPSIRVSKKMKETVNRSCARIWDGVRNLPYTHHDIFTMISKYICFELHNHKYKYVPSFSDEELVLLQISSEYGSYTRSYVSAEGVVKAFREDIRDILVKDLAMLLDTLGSQVLLYTNKAPLLFDFNKLIELFKEELIPYQVLHNSQNDNPVIFYSPARVVKMGYA